LRTNLTPNGARSQQRIDGERSELWKGRALFYPALPNRIGRSDARLTQIKA
jgi:hypothetical protein